MIRAAEKAASFQPENYGSAPVPGALFSLSLNPGLSVDSIGKTAAYLSSWLTFLKLKENRRWMVEGADQAQKAADYILDRLE